MSNLPNESSAVVTLLSGTSPGAFGAFVPLILSTARLSGWLWIFYHGVGNVPLSLGGSEIELNIATGLAGFESVVMCNIGQTISSGNILPGGYWQGYSLPWTFDAGLRLSAQVSDDQTLFAAIYRIKIRLWEKPTA